MKWGAEEGGRKFFSGNGGPPPLFRGVSYAYALITLSTLSNASKFSRGKAADVDFIQSTCAI